MYSEIMGFAEYLDDFDRLGHDPLFEKLTGFHSSITMGKRFRSFSARQVEQIRNLILTMAFKLRLWLKPDLYKIIWKMEVTIHQQFGEKMENTFKVIPKSLQQFFLADSAYGNAQIYSTLLNQNVNFAICLSDTVWSLSYPIQWVEPRVDLAELAKRPYLKGWSDKGKIESALQTAFYPGSEPFQDGNKRTATYAAVIFIQANGWDLLFDRAVLTHKDCPGRYSN